jgi:hypothetical protein
MLAVVDKAGRPVPGRATPGEGDATWSFVPDAPWPSGGFLVRADPALEDLAGNNLARVFDADLRERTAPAARRLTSLAFTVR